MPKSHTTRVVLAWSVHAFTTTGLLWACLAVVALFDGNIKGMWLWLGIALIVDGVDGTMARKANVKKYTPNFDGTSLDVLVDYLTWTFIPALFMYLHIPFGSQIPAMLMFALVCASSVFCYCNLGLKTSDYYFRGFPAAWNVVAIIMWIFDTSAVTNVAVTIVLSILTVAPLTFVHPFRVKKFMWVNITASAAWIATTVALVATQPHRPLVAEALWWVSGAWLMLLSAVRTVQEVRERRDTSGAVASPE
ncbi:MAG: phosphatidylcholine synthase [Ancrocorticia sp.]